MQFVSTRGGTGVNLDDALVNGIADDGGLYVPVELPTFSVSDFAAAGSIPDVAAMLLQTFFSGSRLLAELDQIIADTFSFPIPNPPTTRTTSVSQYSMTLPELFTNEKSMREDFKVNPKQKTKNDLMGIQEEISLRLSMPFASMSIALIAAPLALRSRRKGKTDGFAYGVLVLGVYFVLLNLIEPQSLNPLHQVILRAWIPNSVLLLAGLFLMFRVDRT